METPTATVSAQLELPMPRRRVKSAPKEDAAVLVLALRGKGWLSAAQLAAAMDWDDRRVREAAESAEGHVLSFPGSPGYRLTREATPDERDRALRAFHSQAKRMLERANRISSIHRRGATA